MNAEILQQYSSKMLQSRGASFWIRVSGIRKILKLSWYSLFDDPLHSGRLGFCDKNQGFFSPKRLIR